MKTVDHKTAFLPATLLLLACAVCPAVAQTAAEYNTAGVEYYNAQRWNEAIGCFERAYEKAPGNEAVRRNLCHAHQGAANHLAKEADFRAAAKHLEMAISIDPENPSPLIQLGCYYLRVDMIPDAIARLEEAIELDPYNLDAHVILGDAYYKDGDLVSAREHWEWVHEKDPDRPELAKKLSKADREHSVEFNFRESDSHHFRLRFAPGTPAQSLNTVLSLLERAYLEIGRRFMGSYPPSTVQVIVYNTKGFGDVTQLGEHVGGLYDGKIRIPLVDMNGRVLNDSELKRRLYHEYTHVVVRFLAADNVPWWLNEGLAEEFSRDYGPAQKSVLKMALDSGELLGLKELEGSQLKRLDVESLRLAYAQSHGTVHLLLSQFGERRLRALMSSLAEGAKPEDALIGIYRMDYDELERDFLATIN